MAEEQYQQETISEEKKKPSRRRIIIYGAAGAFVICILCGFILSLLPSSDDGGEPTTLPEEVPTAVQLPEEISLPTNTVLPTSSPTELPTKEPTKVPTEAPPIVEDAQAEYFESVFPGVFLMGMSMQNVAELFQNPRIADEDWYLEVTSELSDLLNYSIELKEFPVPDGCDKCREINDEFVIVENLMVETSEEWIAWLQDPGEISHLNNMAEYIAELGSAFNRASDILDR